MGFWLHSELELVLLNSCYFSAGFFYWIDQVQPYNVGGWNYIDELHKFVDGGMEGQAFIDSVSGIV